MRATISLLGLYNYDNSILDGLTLPSNFTADELTALKTNLLMETAEFELLYSDFDFLKYAITQWCEKRKSTWEWLKNTQDYTYNPLENVDMHLEDHLGEKTEKDITTDFTRTLKSTLSGKDTIDRTDKKTIDNTDKKTGNDTSLHSVYAYDQVNSGSPESGDKTDYNSQIKTDSTTDIKIDQDTKYGKVTDDTGTTKNVVNDDKQLTHNYKKDWHGRDHISAQELIKQEQELAMFNLLDFIIDDFKKRFCLLVY